MQRIPVGRSGGTPGHRPPVLVQHGLFMVGDSVMDSDAMNFHKIMYVTRIFTMSGRNNMAAIASGTIFGIRLGG